LNTWLCTGQLQNRLICHPSHWVHKHYQWVWTLNSANRYTLQHIDCGSAVWHIMILIFSCQF
jgi:hypothetical protein